MLTPGSFMEIGYSLHLRVLLKNYQKNILTSNLFFDNNNKKEVHDQSDNLLSYENLLVGDKVFHQKFGYGIIKNFRW